LITNRRLYRLQIRNAQKSALDYPKTDSAPAPEPISAAKEARGRQGPANEATTAHEERTLAHADGRVGERTSAYPANVHTYAHETNQHGASPSDERDGADKGGKRARRRGTGRSEKTEQGRHIRRDQPQDGTTQAEDKVR